MSVDDVGSTKIIKTSEFENSNSTLRKGQLRDTFSAGSDNFEMKLKDHEHESARASDCWEASHGSTFGCSFFDRLGGRSMPEPLCGFVGGGGDDAQQEKPKRKPHDPKTKSSSEGLTNCFYFVCHAEYKHSSLGSVVYPSA